MASMKSAKVLQLQQIVINTTGTVYDQHQSPDHDNQAKHFVPWMEYPRPTFPDYCSGVFYIMSGQVKDSPWNTMAKVFFYHKQQQAHETNLICPEYF